MASKALNCMNADEGGGVRRREFRGSLSALVAKCGRGVERLIYRRRRSNQPFVDKDLAQEVYIRLHRLQAEDPVENPCAYVLKVAESAVNDFALGRDRAQSRRGG